MRQGIGLMGYGGRDPLVEFKREAHDMYEQLRTTSARTSPSASSTSLTPQAAPPSTHQRPGERPSDVPACAVVTDDAAPAGAATASRRW
jgi:preprotein translocase subunit SecA